jgi:hypothetical protein
VLFVSTLLRNVYLHLSNYKVLHLKMYLSILLTSQCKVLPEETNSATEVCPQAQCNKCTHTFSATDVCTQAWRNRCMHRNLVQQPYVRKFSATDVCTLSPREPVHNLTPFVTVLSPRLLSISKLPLFSAGIRFGRLGRTEAPEVTCQFMTEAARTVAGLVVPGVHLEVK